MRHLVLLICYCFALSVAHAQSGAAKADISLPNDGAVFQQDKDGKCRIKITGTYNSIPFSKYGGIDINIRRLNVAGGSLVDPNASYFSSPSPNYYRFTLARDGTTFWGTYELPAGWYDLTLTSNAAAFAVPGWFKPRGWVVSKTIKFGVGEVYIIAGQSNAQGLPNKTNSQGITNDENVAKPLLSPTTADGIRVQPMNVDENVFADFITLNNIDAVKATYMTPLSSVASVGNKQGIAPAGNSLWYWADLGKRISNSFAKPVPVAFYNVAWGGTHIKAWSESKDATTAPLGPPPTIRPSDGQRNTYPPGAP